MENLQRSDSSRGGEKMGDRRRVVPGWLLDAGFKFLHPEWTEAAVDQVGRWRRRRHFPVA